MREKPLCQYDLCPNRAKSKGFCSTHYTRLLKYGDPTYVKPMEDRAKAGGRPTKYVGQLCSISDCSKKAVTKDLCPMHYQRLRQFGNVNRERAKPIYALCLTESCQNLGNKAHGLCTACLSRHYRSQDPDMVHNAKSKRKSLKRNAYVENVKRVELFQEFNGICYLCDLPIDPDSDWHVDHIIPLCRGGEHSYENTAPTHPRCNVEKGGKLPHEFLCGIEQ